MLFLSLSSYEGFSLITATAMTVRALSPHLCSHGRENFFWLWYAVCVGAGRRSTS